MADRVPLYYTFGNHMHWVDMEWLWGYHVLPGSVGDMIKFCRETGAKGCVNFDGIGCEKMAAEAPEALADLRQAVQEGWIEPVGCSYGQPYGLFHGGESNVRQRIYGVRCVMRLLGVRPRTFWEEEFDFFPQLPQMLNGVGLTGASLYFQWTWHTPEIPIEADPVVWWMGMDGSKLICATRNRLNLHQWPEDFRLVLDELAAFGPVATMRRALAQADQGTLPIDNRQSTIPLVLQWLELMPSPDWMCRSELMSPMLKELTSDDRFDVKFATLGEYLLKVQEGRQSTIASRQYSLDDVWHGMTLGKNGDNHPCRSAQLEHALQSAETASAILGVFGRPYEPWDVYPVWEYEECWRQLLAAQHHDNHECEGLCGHVAEAQFAYVERALGAESAVERLARRVRSAVPSHLLLNRFGTDMVHSPGRGTPSVVPCLGYRVIPDSETVPAGDWVLSEDTALYETEAMSVVISLKTGLLVKLRAGKQEIDCSRMGVPGFSWSEEGVPRVVGSRYDFPVTVEDGSLFLICGKDGDIGLWYKPLPHLGVLEITVSVDLGEHAQRTLDPGVNGSVKATWEMPFAVRKVFADSPYAVQEVKTGSGGRRKYPQGDWMTSSQWFEEVNGAFTSQSFVDFVSDDGSGLLLCHSGAQQWLIEEGTWSNVLLSKDPWDGRHSVLDRKLVYWLVPHEQLTNAQRIQWASYVKGRPDVATDHWLFFDSKVAEGEVEGAAPIPDSFSFAACSPQNVVATALYRESEDYSGRDLESYAGRGMGYPYILRLVEYDGLESEVELTIAGPVAKAFKTNLLGEIEEDLIPERGDDTKLTPYPEQLKPFKIEAALIKFKMRPYEIATLYLDIVPGRKQVRDLDAKREVWATVHR